MMGYSVRYIYGRQLICEFHNVPIPRRLDNVWLGLERIPKEDRDNYLRNATRHEVRGQLLFKVLKVTHDPRNDMVRVTVAPVEEI